MTGKRTFIKQTELAFDFLQRLYLEASYLIKEIEGLLYEEEDLFVIGKPEGYGVSTRGTKGLEPNLVNLWLLRKFGVFFAPETRVRPGGVSTTKVDASLKVFYLRVLLNERDLGEPKIYSGVIYDVHAKSKEYSKFEKVMGYIEWNDEKIFRDKKSINYEDTKLKLRGKLIENNLFDINSSEDIYKLIIMPSLKLYRKY